MSNFFKTLITLYLCTRRKRRKKVTTLVPRQHAYKIAILYIINKRWSTKSLLWGDGDVEKRTGAETDITNTDKESHYPSWTPSCWDLVSLCLFVAAFFFLIKHLFCYFYNLSKFCILKASSILLGLFVWKLNKTKQNTLNPNPSQTTQHFILKTKNMTFFLSFFFEVAFR